MKVAFLRFFVRIRKREGNILLNMSLPAHALRALLSCVIVFQFLGLTSAQDPVRPPDMPPTKNEASKTENSSPVVYVASLEDYKIGPSDVIEIKIANAPELSGTYAVSATGAILMPFLGAITVKEKTPPQLSKLIGDRLRGDYLKDPQVSITVTQYNSRSFFIQGSVRNPGVYIIKGKASLFKLINIAGGLTESHGSVAFIFKRTNKPVNTDEEEETYELKQANISSLFTGNFEQNVNIEPGDLVNIPPANVFYVAGEVLAPGSYTLKEGTTLRQAIVLARGTNFKAALGRGLIMRDNTKTGERVQIPVDIGRVMNGKKDDIPLLANDIVIVPNSKLKSFGGAILGAMTTNAARVPIR
jgi:polysaccharide export outer membrane protein